MVQVIESLKDTFSEEQCLEVVPQRDGNDGEICREREDGEEAEKVVDDGEVPRLSRFGLEVERVEVVDLLEGEDRRESEQEVKCEDEEVV